MELKQMAKARADAQRQREQKAFLLEPSARIQPTVPEPFKLHESGASERQERLLAELEEQRMAECTFHPKTNEASSKQLMQRALQREHFA